MEASKGRILHFHRGECFELGVFELSSGGKIWMINARMTFPRGVAAVETRGVGAIVLCGAAATAALSELTCVLKAPESQCVRSQNHGQKSKVEKGCAGLG